MGRYLVDTLHRVCFIPSMIPNKKSGLVGYFNYCWVLSHFFVPRLFEVVRGVWCVVRGAWFWVYSRYLVSTTPPTVFNQSFWNFTGVFIMVWRCACAFYSILKLFFFQFFHIFNLDFFCIMVRGSEFIVGTFWAQILLQFLTNPSEILQVSSSWSEDVHVLFTESLSYFFFTFFTFLT